MENQEKHDEPEPNFTQLLAKLGDGRIRTGRDFELSGQMLQLVYGQLRAIAKHQMRTEPSDHTLQPTALVHEAWVRLFSSAERSWQNRKHFLGFAGRAMRSILVDHARKRDSRKREPDGEEIPLDLILNRFQPSTSDLHLEFVEFDLLLSRLGSFDKGLVKLVELRFFVGLTMPETARVLGISLRKAEREWKIAKAWLKLALEDDAAYVASDEPAA